jgi:hypothetical protein
LRTEQFKEFCSTQRLTFVSFNAGLFREFRKTYRLRLIFGVYHDALGTAILLGVGGVTAALLQDTTPRLLPFNGGLSKETT